MRNTKKFAVAAGLSLAAFGVTSASAADLGVRGAGNDGQGHVQHSDKVDATCDNDGVELYLQENGAGRVTRGEVTQIDNACKRAMLQVRLFNAAGNEIAESTKTRVQTYWMALDFGDGVNARDIAHSTITIADRIS